MHRTAPFLGLLAAALLASCLALDCGGSNPDPPDPKSCTNVVCPPTDACNGDCDEGECVYFYSEPGCAPPPG